MSEEIFGFIAVGDQLFCNGITTTALSN